LTKDYGSVFIADSVQCGYGRTGKFYSHDHAEINADIYSMAKGMGNGFPIGAISISPEIAPKYFMLGTTFGGNHLACAAAIAVLDVIEKENLMQNAEEVGNYLMEGIAKIPELKNLRGKGLMIGFDVPDELKDLKKNLLYKHKIFTGEAKPNVIRLLPSLALTKNDADKFLMALQEEVTFLVSQTENIPAPLNA
jgi:acetylornithine aminotransferase